MIYGYSMYLILRKCANLCHVFKFMFVTFVSEIKQDNYNSNPHNIKLLKTVTVIEI
jgi:hypothetical protein